MDNVKKKRLCISGICLLIIIFNIVFSVGLIKRYPKIVINNENLFGDNGENLKDFNVTEDGILIAQTDDPWVYYTLFKTIDVNSVKIIVDSVKPENTWAQLHFILEDGSWIHQTFYIHNGTNIIKIFNNKKTLNHVSVVRFDLVSISGASVKVDKIIINNNLSIILQYYIISMFVVLGVVFFLIMINKDKRKGIGKFYRASRHIIINFFQVHVNIKKILLFFIFFMFIVLSLFQMELSTSYDNVFQLLDMDIKYILINIVTIFILFAVIQIFMNSIWKACVIYSILTCIISVVNYFTIKFHGTPLSLMELKNIRTAINVIGGYHFEIEEVSNLLEIFILETILCGITRWLSAGQIKKSIKEKLFGKICIGVILSMLFYFCYISPEPLMSKNVGWSWEESYHQYGYMACTVKAAVTSYDFLKKPDGYEEDCVYNINVIQNDVQNEYPDIILILNESFYDLRLISNIETDVPFMENIDTLENTVRGYTVVPVIGGATNSSEYELLTSNSLQLMQGITPFNVIDMNNANSIISHLKQLGYSTMGIHIGPAINYNRINAYKDMGFDITHFFDDFFDVTYYGNRRYFGTDKSLYDNTLVWLKEIDESPHFTYLLTIQNHGEWDINEEGMDIVHTLNDFGEYGQQVNEYLSCIRMSDLAFTEFINNFKTSNRKTIVCMVGDHCPSFASKICENKDNLINSLLLRCTPFVIWANYDIESKNIGMISMNYLIPTLLENAKINLSPYYQYMINLRNDLPVLTSYDSYFDKDMKEYSYDSETDYSEKVNNYFYLEYNNLQKTKNRNQNLFDAYE